jgi:hypothetical protein
MRLCMYNVQILQVLCIVCYAERGEVKYVEYRLTLLFHNYNHCLRGASSWKADSRLAAQEVHRIYETRRILTVTLRAPTGPSSDPHDSSATLMWNVLRSILICPSHPHLGLPKSHFHSGFPAKILYAFIMSHACYMAHPFHLPWFDHPNNRACFNSDHML